MRPTRLGRLSIALSLLAVLAQAACAGPRITAKERDQAAIQYDLGVEALRACDARTALEHFQQAVKTDPELEVAHAALGLTYHMSFADPLKAIAHYQKALELRPKSPEVSCNFANVYLDLGRYDEAIALYEKALEDVLYKTPFIAENNLGWCLYKKGEVQKGIDHIRTAIAANPGFCLGYRNLGLIYGEMGEPEKSAENFVLYAKNCPSSPDAQFRLGMILLKKGDKAGAKEAFLNCASQAPASEEDKAAALSKGCRKAQDLALLDECRKYRDLLEAE
jgi:Tfp pilus assembly protein PilF